MEAWVTLTTNDDYAVGCLVLAASLRQSQTTRLLHCLVTPGVSGYMRKQLEMMYDEVSVVDVLDSRDSENLSLFHRPDLGVTFTKLNCWRLLKYRKCVFLDADTLVLQNADELFSHDELSAVSDVGWPDVFNSGVFVFEPNLGTYRQLILCAMCGSFDGGDQGVLNGFFNDWRLKDGRFRLSFIYNMVVGNVYSYAAAFKRFGAGVKIVHFLGATKPWKTDQFNLQNMPKFYDHWWNTYNDLVRPRLRKLDDVALVQQRPKHVTFSDTVLEHSSYRDSSEGNSSDGTFSSIGSHILHGGVICAGGRRRRPEESSVTPPVEKVKVVPTLPKPLKLKRVRVKLMADEPLIPSTYYYGYSEGPATAMRRTAALPQANDNKTTIPVQCISSDLRRNIEVCPPAHVIQRTPPRSTNDNIEFASIDAKPKSQILTTSRGKPESAIAFRSEDAVASTSAQLTIQENSNHRRKAWEEGNIDYTGSDSFDHIQKRLDEYLDSER